MSTNFTIGYYRYKPYLQSRSLELIDDMPYDLFDTIKSYDHMLHQSLDKISRERCLRSNNQIKKYKSILDAEPILSKCFSKNELKKFSLLWISIMAGYQNTAELLVRSGVDVNERFGCRNPQVLDKKWTILHLLLGMVPSPENERLIGLVMDHGADLQARDNVGQTPLHYSVINGRVQITEMLLEKEADVNAVADNSDGMTPLLLAVGSTNLTVNGLVPLLIKHGADLLVKDFAGWNALHHVAKVHARQDVELAKILIEKGVSLHDRNETGEQPIHLAVMTGHDELVKIFLDHGADANAHCDGQPLLFVATKYCTRPCNKRVVINLLEHGADVNLRMHDSHRTALHSICDASAVLSMAMVAPTSVTGIIELLLYAGADVLAEDHVGKTPLAIIFDAYNKNTIKVVPAGPWEIIKALALKKVRRPTIELKDERIIERYPAMWGYYRNCIKEIYSMKSARFFGTYTLFDLLAKSEYQTAMLMKNPEFDHKFRLCSRNEFGEFPVYAGYLCQAFKRAERYFHSMQEQEDLINEAVYNTLPYVVVQNVVRYILNGLCSKNVR